MIADNPFSAAAAVQLGVGVMVAAAAQPSVLHRRRGLVQRSLRDLWQRTVVVSVGTTPGQLCDTGRVIMSISTTRFYDHTNTRQHQG